MSEYLLPALVVIVTVGLSWPLGRYMSYAMNPTFCGPIRRFFETTCIAVLGKSAGKAQSWKQYCRSLLTFNVLMFVVVYAILTTQQWHPLNPDGKTALEPSLAFNTAASFCRDCLPARPVRHANGARWRSDRSRAGHSGTCLESAA